jgi:very-short-patch-repair endonuclease
MSRRRIRDVSHPVQQRARELRQEMTPAETRLWAALRDRQLDGLKFRRQHPSGRFVVDFCCPAQRLIGEVDGDVHDRQVDRDAARTEYLAQRGYRVLRFRNEAVMADLDTVLGAIRDACG